MSVGNPKVGGVIGYPIAHSLSPRLHRFWLSAHGIDGHYVPLAVRREDFATTVQALVRSGFAGVNVTVPHKEAAFALAHRNDSAAMAAGATNLLIFLADGTIVGRNTDAEGLRASLAEALGPQALAGKKAVLMGAGGAARAALFSLDALAVGEIAIVNRHHERAQAMALAIQPHLRARLGAVDKWENAVLDADLLINATSGGMKGAAALAFDVNLLPKTAIVCDLVYNPVETALLRRARENGHRVVDGLGMLIHQAIPTFEAFFGLRPAANDAVRVMLKDALDG